MIRNLVSRYLWNRAEFRSRARPIVIGGCGRSGTTLLRVILDSHPHICCGPESSLLVPRGRLAVYPAVLHKRFEVPVDQIEQRLKASRSQPEFVDWFYGEYAKRRDRPRWAEKTPVNVRYISYIFRHFPEARFLHMIRDGRDVICSLRTHPRHRVVDGQLVAGGQLKPLGKCITRWVSDVTAGQRHRHDPRYMEVKYEDVIHRAEPTLRRVLDFVGESWDDRVLHHEQFEGSSRDVLNFPQNPEALQPINTQAHERWQRDLTEADKDQIKRRAGRLLRELGYAEDDSW